MKKKLISALAVVLSMQMTASLISFPASAENNDVVYSVPQSQSEVYNMNVDWDFLIPTQNDTLSNAIESSKDSSGKYFYDVDYAEDGVKGAGYKDAQGNIVEGDEWTNVSIPHAINGLQTYASAITGSGGKGTRCMLLYRKEFTVPEKAEGGKVFFELEGIRQGAYVWVNGQKVGYYEAGIAAFGFDITNYVKPGEKAIIAIAEDGTSARDASVYLHETKPGSEWGAGDGSVYQWNTNEFNPTQDGLVYDAKLYVSSDIYQTLPLYNNLKTTGTYIYGTDYNTRTNSATINVDAEVRNESDLAKDLSLEVAVVDKDGILKYNFESDVKNAAAASDKGVVYETAVENDVYDTDEGGNVIALNKTQINTPDVTHITASYKASDLRFWSLDDPYLYTVYTILKDSDGTVLDVKSHETGFRKVSYSVSGGLKINDQYVWLRGYAQRSTNGWAVLGIAPDWLSDYDMELLKGSNANFVRWMHTAPRPTDVRAADKYGVAIACPAGDKEGNAPDGRKWSQRTEAMRDVMIYYRNNPSIIFWETGNSPMGTAEKANEMAQLREKIDPNGMRFIGARSVQAADQMNYQWMYAGTMLEKYASTAKAQMEKNGIFGPIQETEYSRGESPRRVWDDFSPPDYDYVGKYAGSAEDKLDANDLTQEDFALKTAQEYSVYYADRMGGSSGNDYYSAIAALCWTDSLELGRNRATENARVSGRVDPVRQEKENYYVYQAMQNDNAQVKILGHWSYPELSADTYNYYDKTKKDSDSYYIYDKSKKLKRDPKNKTVYVIGSPKVSKVELYVTNNGKEELIGSCDTPESTFIYSFNNVDITKGNKVTAVGYDKLGKEVTRDEIERTYDAYSIRLKPVTSKDGWRADGSDIAYFDVEVLDKNGNVCALNYDRINFKYSGNGKWLGGYNSGMGVNTFQTMKDSEGLSNYFGGVKTDTGYSLIAADYAYAECGTNRVFVKSTREAGDFTLTATLCDSNGNETGISATEKITSSVFDNTDGISETMPSSSKPSLPDNAPVIERIAAMLPISKTATVSWADRKHVSEVDNTVYFTVKYNGEEMNFDGSKAYESNNNSVYAPMLPILDKLKADGADVEYTYDTSNPDDIKLIVNTNGYKLTLQTSQNNMFIEDPNDPNHIDDLTDDFPTVKNGVFFAQIDFVLRYIPGVSRLQNNSEKTFDITYTKN